MNKLPSTIFYARQSRDKDSRNDQLASAIQFKYQTIDIETNDIVDVEANDIVKFQGEAWLVIDVAYFPLIRNTEFSENPSKRTVISLRK